jgi:hypothetical protein
MKLFECQHCGQPLYFENSKCESCGRQLGYLPSKETITALEPAGNAQRALADPKRRYRLCANAQYEACNWLVVADGPETFCAACRHNRNIPDLSIADNLIDWRAIELAKHRLFYTLLKLGLPLKTRAEDPARLAFDFLSPELPAPDGTPHVLTGHDNGLITINLAEADDAHREKQRRQMGEPYRTLLGHFRHEIAHYYWDKLIPNNAANLESFRQLFGDERRDYAQALQDHYNNGPPPDWTEHYVTSYASSHPWEDFAETWAHYLHMVDTLETASSFGLTVRPRLHKAAALTAAIDFDPHTAELDQLISTWLPLTFAVNSVNRSMGLPDLYPFVLSPPAIAKLAYVHDRIRENRTGRRSDNSLRAIIAGLRRRVGVPTH